MRQIKPARVIGAPSGVSIRTRLRLSEADEIVLRALGDLAGTCAGRDLKAALAGEPRMIRKQRLTSLSSSRWAGTWTAESDRQMAFSQMAQRRHRDSVESAISTIERRLSIGIGGKIKVGSKTINGYTSALEQWAKQQRLQVLKGTLAKLESDIAGHKLHIVRGGAALLNTRHNLEAAGLTADQWSDLWWSARHRISANGSHDELLGNLTIRVSPEGVCSILLPGSLHHLANMTDHKHYVLDAQVKFSYRESDWQRQISNGAVSYEISRDAASSRWYLDASWKLSSEPTTPRSTNRCVGVDLNADHLAAWVTDMSGNPVGRPIDISLDLTGSSGQRDGHLRWAISQLLAFAKLNGAGRIFIENLNFSDGKSRESFGHNKPFRHLISSFPTAKFKNRLQAMSVRAGLELVAVDPAYTSKSSKVWVKPTSTKSQKTSSHQAASLAISRRGLSLSLSRRNGVTGGDQRIASRGLPTRRGHSGLILNKTSLTSQRRPGQGDLISPYPSPPRPPDPGPGPGRPSAGSRCQAIVNAEGTVGLAGRRCIFSVSLLRCAHNRPHSSPC